MNIEEVNYKIEFSNTRIYNSYQIKKIKDMKNILLYIREKYPTQVLSHNQRSLFGMINEWRAHNLLYKLGIARERTKHVDLNLGDTIPRRVGYFFLSLLYF